ncbi:MAG: PHP domain-containing protein [Bacillota bacterium]
MSGPRFPDLHVHTHFSDDGDYSPRELVAAAERAGVNMIAFTDHDSAAATLDTSPPGIAVLPGVEISSGLRGVEVHILAYGIDPNHPTLREILQTNDRYRRRQADRRLHLLEAQGFRVDAERAVELAGGRPPKTGALLAMLHQLNPSDERLFAYGTPERPDWSSFYRDFFSPGGVASSPLQSIAPTEIVGMIQQMDAVPVLAHPGVLSRYLQADVVTQLIRSLKDEGLEALEAYTSWHNREQAEMFHQLARDLGLDVTVGSDYHGPTSKPHVRLGDPQWTPAAVRRSVYAAYLPLCLD